MENMCHALGYRPSNGERRLRASESPNVERIKNDKNVITGYKWILNEYRPQKEVITDGLDDKLKATIIKIGADWNNQEKIKEINEAIKSKNKYLKEAVIRKYN